MKTTITPRGRSAGFTLIEVLITMFVIAIALLGTAALQAYAMKINQGGQFRGQAVLLGVDLLERIEANNPAAIKGQYVAVLPDTAKAPDCISSPCSADQMAAYDLGEFQEALQQQLPDTSATITFTGAGPYTYTVQISWRERAYRAKSTKSASDAQTEAFSYTVSRTIYDMAASI